MTAFTNMQMTMQEEDNLPNLAVQAFRDAFKQASESSTVVFVKDHQLIEKLPSGKILKGNGLKKFKKEVKIIYSNFLFYLYE